MGLPALKPKLKTERTIVARRDQTCGHAHMLSPQCASSGDVTAETELEKNDGGRPEQSELSILFPNERLELASLLLKCLRARARAQPDNETTDSPALP